MTNKEQNDRIEKYLLNTMEDKERIAFEADLESDAGLQELLEHKKILISGIRAGFNNEFKSKLKSDDQWRKQRLRTRRIQYISGIAAVVIIGLFSQFFLSFIKHDSSRIYSEYYKPYPNITIPISRSEENGDSPFYQFETANFKQALVGFDLILNEKPDNDAALFYAGIASMELLEFEEAIKFLQRVGMDKLGLFTRPAIWYLSLAYINSDNYEMAADYLNKLVAGDDIYSTNSKKILKRIN